MNWGSLNEWSQSLGNPSPWALPLFPIDGSAATVTMTVWAGVLVVVFFHLRFGWTLSGLVIPGYLVPLLLVKPVSVAIIAMEAIATYLIARMLSDHGQRLSFWSGFFGRDRFLLIILISILVRAAADGWWLPLVGQWLNETYGFQVDYRNDLHSFGLIVVSLMANYFWKPRLVSGLFTGSITLLTTFVFVRFIFLEWTNFSLGGLHYMYEDISTSLLASPKSYVTVIITAWLASWFNLRYSWDFNGVLIPALLGLLWHEPAKILVTVLESAWILMLANLVLALPIWKRTTIEGGRKLLLFFTLAAAHRLLLAHLLPYWSEMRVTDAYGFGYLLTTLLAVKSHEKKIPLRMLRATLQTSMLGAVAASVLGFALSHVSLDELAARNDRSEVALPQQPRAATPTLRSLIDEQHVRLYSARVPGSYQAVLPGEMQRFRRGLALCLEYRTARASEKLASAATTLAGIGYELLMVEQRYLVLRHAEASRGWGTFVLDLDRPEGLLIEVPAPLDEWGTVESGYMAFQRLDAQALSIAGSPRNGNSDRSSDMLGHRNTFVAAFHRMVAEDNVLQIRGWNALMVQPRGRQAPGAARDAIDSVPSQLYIRRALPASLNLAQLRMLASDLQILWQDAAWTNALREQTRQGFAELVLSQHDRRRLRNQMGVMSLSSPVVAVSEVRPLRELLDQRLERIARIGSEAYAKPLVEEMIFFDEEVVRPLIQLARECHVVREATSRQREVADGIAVAAANFGYRLILLHDQTTGDDYYVLDEQSNERHWGTFVLRAGMASPYVVEVPRPVYELQTFQFGAALFERARASALLLAGAHPLANSDGSADLTRLANKVNASQLFRQVLLRELPEAPMLLIQTRAVRAPIDADLVVATEDGSSRPEHLTPLVGDFLELLDNDGLETRLVDGSELTAGYELGIMLQAASLNHSQNKQMVSVWLSPTLRRQFRNSADSSLLSAQLEAIGIPTREGELYEAVVGFGAKPLAKPLPPEVFELLRSFTDNGDIMCLYRLTQAFPHLRLLRVIDTATDQSFLLVADHDANAAPTVFNLDGVIQQQTLSLGELDAESIRTFARSRHAVLEIRRAP